ncbi:MAG: MOP flippase family protein [Nitrososphaeraceae archaeon]
MENEIKGDVKKSAKWVIINKILVSVFALLQVVILTRFLEKSDFGLISMSMVVVNLSNVFVEMGLTSALLHRQKASNNEYSSVYWMNISISLIFYIITYFSAPFAADFYSDIRLCPIIELLGLNLVFVTLGKVHRTLLQKEFRFKHIFIGEFTSVFVALVLAIYLAYMGFGVYSMVYSTLVKSFVSSIIYVCSDFKRHPIFFKFSISHIKHYTRVGGFSMGAAILDYFASEIDVIIIGKLLGTNSVGVYSLVKQLVLRIYRFVNPVITTILSPYLSKLQDSQDHLRSTYIKIVKLVARINFPIYMCIAICSKQIIEILYGSVYVEGSFVLVCLSISYAVQTISNPVGSLQIATGRTDLAMLWTFIRIFLVSIIVYIASYYGTNGIAIGLVFLSVVFTYVIWIVMISKMISLSFVDYLRCFYLISLLTLVVIIIFKGIVNVNIENNYILIFFNSVASCVLLYLICFFADKESFRFYTNKLASLFTSVKNRFIISV